MTRQRQRAIPVWLAWVAANAIGGAVAGGAIDAAGVIGAVFFGIAGGIPQWLVLRRHRPVTGEWVLATGLGGATAWIVLPFFGYVGIVFFPILLAAFGLTQALNVPGVDQVAVAAFYFLAAAVPGGIAGAFVGSLQVSMVPSVGLSGPRWTRASAASCALACGIAGFDLYWRVTHRPLGILISAGGAAAAGNSFFLIFPTGAVSGAVFGVAYGAITGLELARLLRA